MLKNLISYRKVSTLDEVSELLNNLDCCCVAAGGTALIKSGNSSVKHLIDINEIDNLKKITVTDSYIEIGAAITLNEILYNTELKKIFSGVFSEACLSCASEPLRNLITLGGNIVQVYPWSNIPPLLMILEAIIITDSRNITAQDFFKKHPKLILKKNEIVTGIKIELNGNNKNLRLDFQRLTHTSFDYAMITSVTGIKTENSSLSDLRICIGSANPVPVRFYDVENEFRNQIADDIFFEKLKTRITEKVNPVKDFRCSEDYKKKVSANLIIKSVKKLMEGK
jgi:CO/xanthine dehydrogenase FAD-binding subunit